MLCARSSQSPHQPDLQQTVENARDPIRGVLHHLILSTIFSHNGKSLLGWFDRTDLSMNQDCLLLLLSRLLVRELIRTFSGRPFLTVGEFKIVFVGARVNALLHGNVLSPAARPVGMAGRSGLKGLWRTGMEGGGTCPPC